ISAREAGYGATGGTRKSSAATITPFFASASLPALPFRRPPRPQAPPCSSTMIGNGPLPRGLKRRASKGLSPCRRYSTSATSTSYVVCVLVAMRASFSWWAIGYASAQTTPQWACSSRPIGNVAEAAALLAPFRGSPETELARTHDLLDNGPLSFPK